MSSVRSDNTDLDQGGNGWQLLMEVLHEIQNIWSMKFLFFLGSSVARQFSIISQGPITHAFLEIWRLWPNIWFALKISIRVRWVCSEKRESPPAVVPLIAARRPVWDENLVKTRHAERGLISNGRAAHGKKLILHPPQSTWAGRKGFDGDFFHQAAHRAHCCAMYVGLDVS